MATQMYLIDTKVIFGLEDNHTVQPAYANFSRLATKHNVGVFVHEAVAVACRVVHRACGHECPHTGVKCHDGT